MMIRSGAGVRLRSRVFGKVRALEQEWTHCHVRREEEQEEEVMHMQEG